MPKNWKYIKKLLEKEFLCEKLRGHITYDLTDYKPAPWYQQHFIMKFDDEVLLDVPQPERRWDSRYAGTEVHWGHREIITERLFKKYNIDEYGLSQRTLDHIIAEAIEEADKINSHHSGVFGVHDIIDAIGIYLHSDIGASLSWGQEDFVKALAVLDRRCGKRRLKEYASWNYTDFPDWLKRIYVIRFEAEGIKYSEGYLVTHT